MNTVKPVSKSLVFNLGKENSIENKEWLALLSQQIDTFENAEDFRNLNIICVENVADNHDVSDCYGVTLALNLLKADPKAKVLLYGFMPIKKILEKAPQFSLVLKHEHAYWKQLPFDEKAIKGIFSEPKPDTDNGYTATDEAGKYLSRLFHDLHYVKGWDENPVPSKDATFARIMDLARGYFPGLKEKSDIEIVTFLKETKVERPLVKKGEYLDGVYCDVEGTLLVDGKLNDKVVKALVYYFTEGEKITIWTDGNLSELFTKLRMMGVMHPIVSKHDYAGAKAKIVIDDMKEYEFSALTKISAEKFIHVSEIA